MHVYIISQDPSLCLYNTLILKTLKKKKVFPSHLPNGSCNVISHSLSFLSGLPWDGLYPFLNCKQHTPFPLKTKHNRIKTRKCRVAGCAHTSWREQYWLESSHHGPAPFKMLGPGEFSEAHIAETQPFISTHTQDSTFASWSYFNSYRNFLCFYSFQDA